MGLQVVASVPSKRNSASSGTKTIICIYIYKYNMYIGISLRS